MDGLLALVMKAIREARENSEEDETETQTDETGNDRRMVDMSSTNAIPGLQSPYEQSGNYLPDYSQAQNANTGQYYPTGAPPQSGSLNFNNVMGSWQPQYESALNQYQNIPGLTNQMLGYNDTISGLNQVANARAAQGILGGTEAQNLRGNMLSGMAGQNDPLKLQAQQNYLAQRNNLLGMGLNQEQTWANIMANLLMRGYTG